ncbi:RnfABCDGE type electron transport complex subunit D [Candidatus Albibeggiatoa sp. nov. BB20]|uniref:RnfABCDGE type electron transport complex subunit D n=1 Tax=Candidatus Albibeggiatoa sp. nov. BB20 TaxID=3162723 RepID=UPI0033656966
MQSTIVSSPHIHAPASVPWVIRQVIMATIPTALFGVYLFGWPAFNLLIISLVSAIGVEAACLYIANKPVKLFLNDGSAFLTGLLIALTLPPWTPWWIPVIGVSFALVIGKHLYGGIGQNLFNPAMLARVMLLVAFPLEMTTWITPTPLFSANAPGFLESLAITFGGATQYFDAVSSASLLGYVKTEMTLNHTVAESLVNYSYGTSLFGWTAGSLGETSGLLILAGGIYLIYQRIITWQIPVAMLVTLALLATIFSFIDPDHYTNALFHTFNGGTLLVAFFIATDPVTAPSTSQGRILFGMGIGLIEFLIRTWGSFPEGVGFAVLLMNAMTPLIDHYVRPRIYGRDRRGRPLDTQPASNKG